MLWSWACSPEPPPRATEDLAPPRALPAAELSELDGLVDRMVLRRLVLDPGRFVDGAWVSEPEPALGLASGWSARLSADEPAPLRIGWNEIAVVRACGVVIVPVRADPLTEVVSVPYLACSATRDTRPVAEMQLDHRERTYADVRALQSLDFLPELPRVDEPDDAPARWITREEAATACAFLGGRLPRVAEFRVARAGLLGAPTGHVSALGDLDRHPTVGPLGHEDLGGNVAEWVSPLDSASGALVEGPSFLRDDAEWTVPESARSDEIGFRCAFD